ncbi:MAG: S1C family serine protease [Planctomycetota bacterium]
MFMISSGPSTAQRLAVAVAFALAATALGQLARLQVAPPEAPADGALVEANGPDAVIGQTPDSARLNALIEQMDAPVHETRERADLELRRVPGLSLPIIFDRLRDPTLSPEQARRLERVGQHLFLKRGRAGLGVRFARPRSNVGVQIEEVTAGFPAAMEGGLKRGDILLEAEGVKLHHEEDLRSSILACDPGEPMAFRLWRPLPELIAAAPTSAELPKDVDPGLGEELTIRVETRAFSDLGQGGGPPPSSLPRAWSVRLAREGLRTPTIAPDWGEAADTSLGDDLSGLGLAPGGETRASGFNANERRLAMARPAGGQIRNARPPNEIEQLRQQQLKLRLAALQQERRVVTTQLTEADANKQQIVADKLRSKALRLDAEIRDLRALTRP